MSFDPLTGKHVFQGGPCNCSACCGCIDSAPFGRFTGLIRWEVSEPFSYVGERYIDGDGVDLDGVPEQNQVYAVEPGGFNIRQLFESNLGWTTLWKTEFNSHTCLYEIRTDLYPTITMPIDVNYNANQTGYQSVTYTYYASASAMDPPASADDWTGPGYYHEESFFVAATGQWVPRWRSFAKTIGLPSYSHPVVSDGPVVYEFSHIIKLLSDDETLEADGTTTFGPYIVIRAVPDTGASFVGVCSRHQQFWPVTTCMLQTIVDIEEPSVSLSRVLYPMTEFLPYRTHGNNKYFVTGRASDRVFNWSTTQHHALRNTSAPVTPLHPSLGGLALNTGFTFVYYQSSATWGGGPASNVGFAGGQLGYNTSGSFWYNGNWPGTQTRVSPSKIAFTMDQRIIADAHVASVGVLPTVNPSDFQWSNRNLPAFAKSPQFAEMVIRPTDGRPTDTPTATPPNAPIPTPYTTYNPSRVVHRDYYTNAMVLPDAIFPSGYDPDTDPPPDWAIQFQDAQNTIVDHDPYLFEYYGVVAIGGRYRNVYGTIEPVSCDLTPPAPAPPAPPPPPATPTPPPPPPPPPLLLHSLPPLRNSRGGGSHTFRYQTNSSHTQHSSKLI
jgi:hypothetical protein